LVFSDFISSKVGIADSSNSIWTCFYPAFKDTFLSPDFLNPLNPPNLLSPEIPPLVKEPQVESLSPSGITVAAASKSLYFYSSVKSVWVSLSFPVLKWIDQNPSSWSFTISKYKEGFSSNYNWKALLDLEGSVFQGLLYSSLLIIFKSFKVYSIFTFLDSILVS